MAIPDYTLNIDPFWDEEFKFLEYKHENFNNPDDLKRWLQMGHTGKFTGDMCDMRTKQPSWNARIINTFSKLGWKDIGTSYYRMCPGTVLPAHRDTYKRYIEIFNLQGQEHTIRRAVIFLEDWKSGHYLELNNLPITGWKKGYTVIWNNDDPHMAANIGEEMRYTLQVTGHV